MTIRIWMAVLVVIAISGAAYAAFENRAAQQALERYEAQMARAEQEYAEAVERATAQYRESLERAMRAAMRAGDMGQAQEIRETLDELEKERLVRQMMDHRWVIMHSGGEMPITFLEDGTVRTGKPSVWREWREMDGHVVLRGRDGQESVFRSTPIPVLVNDADSVLVPTPHQY